MGYKTLFEQIKTVCAWNSLSKISQLNKCIPVGIVMSSAEERIHQWEWSSFS